MPSRKTTYALMHAEATVKPVRISRYISPTHTTARPALTHSPGRASAITVPPSATATSAPANRATPRAYVCPKSGRITITDTMGAQ